MELRRVLLRILLLALALAALAGVVGVITAAGHTIWRIVITAIATAVAVAIMLPFSRMMDKPKSRVGGAGGMAWTVGAYGLVLALTWCETVLGWRGEEEIGLTLISWVICGLPAVFLLNLSTRPATRIAGTTGVAVATATFCLLMIWNMRHLIGLSYASGDAWWQSGIAAGGLGVLAVINLIHAGTNDGRWWRWIGVAAAIAAFYLAETGIVQQTHSLLGREWLTGLISLAAVLGLANVALLVPLLGMQQWVRWGTIAAAGVCAAAVNVIVSYDRFTWESDPWARVAAGSAIVAGCGSLALLVLARINRRVEYHPDDTAVVATDMAVVCPRCRKSQKIKLGGDACRACGLRIEVTIEEPRCPKCGYLIYMLASPVCPECGTAISSQPVDAGTTPTSSWQKRLRL